MPEFGPSAQDDDNRSAATSRLINCYRQPIVYPDRTRYQLKSVLGTEAFADVSDVFLRACTTFAEEMYAVYGGTLYRIGSNGVVTSLGSISDGETSLSSNNGKLVIAASGSYYTLTGSTISSHTPLPFTSVGSVDFGDQYTLYTEKNGRRIAWSDLADPTTLPALNFATAEATDSDVIRGVYINGRWIIFKETSRVVYYNTGQSGANAWKRVANGVRSTGLKSFGLLTKTDDAVFWVGDDNICRLTADGLNAQPLSYPPVDTAIAQGSATECFYYEDEGQKFCVVRFSDRPSWVFDMATQEWHERAEGATHTAWTVRCTTQLDAAWYGFTDGGLVRKLTRNNQDAGSVLLRRAVSPSFYFRDRASVDMIRIFARTGFHDLGRDAQMWIRLSRDGGDTWTEEKWRSLGDIGYHRDFATWRGQGNARVLTIEANISEPAEIPLWSDFDLVAA